MLVAFESKVKHLASLVTLLIHQLVADGNQTREGVLDNGIEVLSIGAVGVLVSEGTANTQQALQAGQNGAGIIGVQKLVGKIHKARPPAREVALQHPLQHRNELLADGGVCASEDGDETISNARLLIFGYNIFAVDLLGLVPGAIDSVLNINDG